MKNNLMLFYQVQLIDRHIDKLEEQRGDLPLTVEALEAKLENLKVAVDEKAALKIEWIEKRESNTEKINELLDNQKRAKAQLYKVRNNKEYDTITKSIDAADAEVYPPRKERSKVSSPIFVLSMEVEGLNPNY
ncbi:MAG: hypothetical protein IPN18_07185 [Ignavibacteriales bacterium]|nr:hypothetical protein [Ignavibacteriales bacterium]